MTREPEAIRILSKIKKPAVIPAVSIIVYAKSFLLIVTAAVSPAVILHGVSVLRSYQSDYQKDVAWQSENAAFHADETAA